MWYLAFHVTECWTADTLSVDVTHIHAGCGGLYVSETVGTDQTVGANVVHPDTQGTIVLTLQGHAHWK